MVPHSRVSAVGTDHEVERDLNLLGSTASVADGVLDLEPGPASPEISAGELVVEEQPDVGELV